MKLHKRFEFLACMALAPLFFAAAPAFAQTTSTGNSETVVWNCTGSPCPWGGSDSGVALVWPQNSGATSARHGYTTTKPVYLPAYAANGAVVQLNSGSATLYAGLPLGGSHRVLTSIAAGGIFFLQTFVQTFFAGYLPPGMGAPPNVGLGAVFLVPVLYAFIGAIGGLIAAGLYNFLSMFLGGLSFEVRRR